MRAVKQEDLLKLRRYLETIRTRLEELRDALQEHSEATTSAQQNKTISAVISYDEKTAADAKGEADRQHTIQRSIRNWTRRLCHYSCVSVVRNAQGYRGCHKGCEYGADAT
jgi:hypothetical protein